MSGTFTPGSSLDRLELAYKEAQARIAKLEAEVERLTRMLIKQREQHANKVRDKEETYGRIIVGQDERVNQALNRCANITNAPDHIYSELVKEVVIYIREALLGENNGN